MKEEISLSTYFDKDPQISYTFENDFVDFPGKCKEAYKDGKADWKKLKEHYGDFIKIEGWKEEIDAVKNPKTIIVNGNVHLDIAKIDSYSIHALRNGAFPEGAIPFYNAANIGCMETNDGYILFGLRGRDIGKDQFMPMPCGHKSYDENVIINPVMDSIRRESQEELGLYDYEHALKRIFFVTGNSQGLKFYTESKVNASLKQVQELHNAAYSIYANAKKAGAPEKEARAEIKKYSDLPCDAWENQAIYGIENKQDKVEEFLKINENKLMGLGKIVLETHLDLMKK